MRYSYGAEEISLRLEIKNKDAIKINDWLSDKEVYKYLNEDKEELYSLAYLIKNNKTDLLQYRLNQDGRFFLIDKDHESIGFLNLFTVRKYKEYEVVIVIGNPSNWGKQYGHKALQSCMREVFYKWRIECLNAKINKENLRSINMFNSLNFDVANRNEKYITYKMTFNKYLGI